MKFHKYPQEEPEGNLYNKNNFLCNIEKAVLLLNVKSSDGLKSSRRLTRTVVRFVVCKF